MDIKIEQIEISNDGTHHIYRSKPLYVNRFLSVQKFHQPGLAPVQSEQGAYHIDVRGNAAYHIYYTKCFGFYYDRAAVVKQDKWFHILLNGKSFYDERYAWCGNYQDSACVVRNSNKSYLHIDLNGTPLYKQRFCYAGDFRDGIAVIQDDQGYYSHIDKCGNLVHNQWFLDLDVFHKGYARAKDKRGWFHVDKKGMPLYEERFLSVEDFYNGQARVEKETGEIQIITSTAEVIQVIREARYSDFQLLSADLVGYWKTQTIKASVDLKIFDFLPNDPQILAKKVGISESNLIRLMRALSEINLVYLEKGQYYPTQRAAYLTSTHPLSLANAATHWGGSHYEAWSHLTAALKGNNSVYADLYNNPLFEWLDQNQKRVTEYQLAMQSYAKHDYEELSQLFELENYKTIIDAAGGTGTLLFCLLRSNPHLTGVLLERESVMPLIKVPEQLKRRFTCQPFDLFDTWPDKADVILLSRVLHDWDDAAALAILENASYALNAGGKLFIIEFLLDQSRSSGGMLDLNMLVITGAKERTFEDYKALAKEANLKFQNSITIRNYHAIEFAK